MRWFKAPKTVFASHVMNAYQDGSRIYFDVPQAENNSFPFFPDINDAPFDAIAGRPFLHRWTVNLASKSDAFESVEKRTELIGEFPRIDDRYAGRKYQHGWMLVMDPDKPFEGPGARASGFRMNMIGHIDMVTGQQDTWYCGPQSIIQEPQFIPRHKDSPEGDGYIIALVDDLIANYSDLLIFDALKLPQGPIGKLKLPFRLRSGLHGTWADAAKLPAG
jgi:carotenoid cleavage dioxygenase